MKLLLALILTLPNILSVAQPGTEIYLFDVKTKKDKISLYNPKNITNRKGYDNQPFFHPDKNVVYFVSADADGRTDVFAFDYKDNKTRQITSTPEREYSPTVTPDKKYLSCIIQRDNGAQDLGKYPIDGGEPKVLIDNLIVGYHAWGNHDQVAVFTLPQPFKLQLIDFVGKTDTVLAENIGRSIHKIPGQNAISFVHNDDEGWKIMKLNLTDIKITEITKSVSAAEHDMAWMPGGEILMTDRNKILLFSPSLNTDWIEVDSPHFEKGTFSRIALSADGKKLALVVSEE